MCKCSDCIHSHKVEDSEYEKIYECDAEVYDIDNKTCFAPKNSEK